MRIAVVIPVYRVPTGTELISLRQCCKVLSRYDHCLVAPEGLDTSAFQSLWADYGLVLHEERFAPQFFRGLQGYNRLCMSRDFYARFAAYDYMLIYQPDVFVFKDDVEDWCAKGYDYIAPPNVGFAREQTYYSGMHLRVGVGGFSLRSIPAFLHFFDGKGNVFSLWHILTTPSLWIRTNWRFLLFGILSLVRGNKPASVVQRWNGHEDDFFGGVLGVSRYALRKPAPEEAMLFGFDRFPRELYGRTGRLPMGCHAWHKYEYEEFWKDIIERYK